MSKFNQLMEKEHVRNHPMFRGFDDRLKAARERLSRKSAAPDLRDVFSSQKAVGLGTNDRSVRAYIQEAALAARSVLDMCEFPMLPQISFNNVKDVKMAAHDDSQVVDAEILFNVRICTKSGAIRQALIPVVVSRGVVVPPSTLIYDQQMKVIAQSTIDEIVQRNTSYQLPPMRRMYDPPLRGEELDRAASERNTLGWMPREVVTDGMGIRHSSRGLESDASTSEPYWDAQGGGWRLDEMFLEDLETYRGLEYSDITVGGDRGDLHIGSASESENGVMLSSIELKGHIFDATDDPGYIREEIESIIMFSYNSIGGETFASKQSYGTPKPPRDQRNLGWGEEDADEEEWGRESRRQGAFETYAMRLMGQDQTNPGTPSSLAGQPPAGVTQSDATQISNPATDPTMAGVPGGEKTPYGQYAESGSATDSLYRQILAQPTIMQQVQDILTPSRETLIDNISQMISPMMSVLGLRTEDVEWDFLLDDLKAGLGGTTASKIGKAEVRKVALMIAEYATGRRRFGRRRAAADTATALAEMTTYLQSAQDTFKPDELAYYQQLAQEAQSALQGGDEQTAKDLLVELENAFSFTDVPQEQEVPTDYWQTFTANCKKLAQQTNLVKELEVDEDDNRPMKRYMPAGYDLVLEDMVKAEEGGLDTFPRPYSHIERNYILRRYPTCSRDKWLPHLINDGFALNPYGKGPSRLCVRPAGSRTSSTQGAGSSSTKKEARGQGGGAEQLASWLEGVVLLRGCVSSDGIIELTHSNGEPTQIYVAVVHDGSGFNPGAALAVSEISADGALEEAYQVLEDHLFSGNGYLDEDDIKEAYDTEENEGYNPITESFDGASFAMTAPEFKQVVESAGGMAGQELQVIEFADNFEEEEPEEGFGEEPEAPIEPKLSRSAQMDDEGEEEPETFTIYLDNLDHDDGMVTVHAQGPGAAAWAKNDQSIMGSNWETDGPDFAYAIISDEVGLVEALESEGYEVNDDDYSPMDEEESEDLAIHMDPPGPDGRHPQYSHLVMAEWEPHHGSYIVTFAGHEGDLLMSAEDVMHMIGSDAQFEEGFGYVTDEYVDLLSKEGEEPVR